MIIKRFEAATAPETLKLVKDALGLDAVIFSQKTLDKGTANERVEIMAAVDQDSQSPPLPDPEPKAATQVSGYSYQTIRKSQKKAPSTKQTVLQQPENKLESQTVRRDFSRLLQEKETARTSISIKKGSKPKNARQWRDTIIKKVQALPITTQVQNGPTIIALVGPTGVGKTTTAAKLAAWYHIQENKKVTLLSMDCYRIGATDQLRTYARIMRLPCEVAIRKEDLEQAIARHADTDVIIIDTTGKSPYDNNHIDELCQWFAEIDYIQPLLVVSATTKKEDLRQIVKVYNPLEPHSLVLTKLDETRTYANLCQQVAASDLPVGYLSMGQRVPEDFLVPDKPFLDTFFKKGWAALEQHIN
jgi:flagellar biosynthesis protein FlhF